MILAGSLLVCAAMTLFGVLLHSTVGIPISFSSPSASAPPRGRSGSTASCSTTGPTVHGRAFAPLETRFQAAWVLGAVLGIIPVASAAGLGVLGLVLAFGGLSYLAALRATRSAPSRTKLRPDAVDRALDRARENLKDRGRQGRRRAGARRGRREVAQHDDAPPPASPRRPPPARGVSSTGEPVAPPPRRRRSGMGGRSRTRATVGPTVRASPS